MSSTSATDRFAILDRDGTLVVDRGYLDDPAGLEFCPLAARGLQLLGARGYRLIVVTNQSGVGRGLFPVDRVLDMNQRLDEMVRSLGVELDAIYFCPHLPEDGCDCRKPAQALMLRAIAELGLNPRRSVVIGDKDSDIEFGRRAGTKTVLIRTPGASTPGASTPGASTEPLIRPDHVASDLLDATRLITGS